MQHTVNRVGIKSSSASFNIYGGVIEVHVLEKEFDKRFPGMGVITERDCTKYPYKKTYTTDSGIEIYCLREAIEAAA